MRKQAMMKKLTALLAALLVMLGVCAGAMGEISLTLSLIHI